MRAFGSTTAVEDIVLHVIEIMVDFVTIVMLAFLFRVFFKLIADGRLVVIHVVFMEVGMMWAVELQVVLLP